MRRIPFDPPWVIIPIVGLLIGAAAAASHTDSLLITYALGMLATIIGTLAMDRWYERTHPRRRDPRR
jgi:hypothetical protein